LVLQPGVVYSDSTVQLFNQYRTADATTLLNGILAGDMRNDPTNGVWHALYQNGVATTAQVEANRLWNVWDGYRNTSNESLAQSYLAGNFSNNDGVVVWNALLAHKAGLSAAVDAAKATQNKNNCQPASTCGGGVGTGGAQNVPPIIQLNSYQISIIDNAINLPQFSHAMGSSGLDISKLSIAEKTQLIALFKNNGVPVDFDSLGSEGEAMNVS
jgi:hypothetical protein